MQLAERLAQLLAAGDVDGATALVATVEATAPAAAAVARSAMEMQGTDPTRAKLQLATLHLMEGDRDRAVAIAAAISPDAPPQHRSSCGAILLAAGRYDEAVEVLRQVIVDDPEDRDAHQNLATAAAHRRDYGEAMIGYARAFEIDPGDLQPIHNLIAMFAEMGKWLGAIAALELSRGGEPPPEVAVALDLASLQLMQQVANGYPSRNSDADADRTIEALVTNAATRGTKTQLAVARALLDVDRTDDANRLARTIAETPVLDVAERGELHYVEGVLAERAGDVESALGSYERSLAADARRVDAATNASSLLLANGSAEALARIGGIFARVSADQRTGTASLQYNEAIYLRRIGRRDDARACLERALAISDSEGMIHELAKRALEALDA